MRGPPPNHMIAEAGEHPPPRIAVTARVRSHHGAKSTRIHMHPAYPPTATLPRGYFRHSDDLLQGGSVPERC